MEFEPNQPIVERHIRRLLGLEDTQAKVILKQYVEAFKQLKAKLLATPTNTFTEARLESTLKQISVFIEALNKNISDEINQSSLFSFEQGVEDSVSEINKFEKQYTGSTFTVPLDPILNSVDKRTYLVNQFKTSMFSYNQEARSDIQQVLTQGLIQGKTFTQVVNDIGRTFEGSTWKANRIVRTEMHNIYNISKMDGMEKIKEKHLPDLKKMLVHAMDNRTAKDSKVLAAQNPIVDIDKPFVFTYQGEKRVFMNPPDRPNDRAIMIPVRESYIENSD